MCGISGIISFNKNINHQNLKSDLKKMIDEIFIEDQMAKVYG